MCVARPDIILIYTRKTTHGPLTRYTILRVAHAPGMPGTFSPPPRVSDPNMHHVTCVTHVPWCMTGSLNSDFLWSRWRGKRSRHSQRMRKPQFYVSDKRPMYERVRAAEILPRGRQLVVYPTQTLPWQLMAWWRKASWYCCWFSRNILSNQGVNIDQTHMS